MGQPKLQDSAQALEIGMFNDIEDQCVGDGDQPVNRIVDDLQLVRGVQNRLFLLKIHKTAGGMQ